MRFMNTLRCAVFAVLACLISSASADIVFEDSFDYTTANAFVAEGGWSSRDGNLNSDAGTGQTWGRFGTVDFNYSETLSAGYVLEGLATVNRYYGSPGTAGNGYSYIVEVLLWDGSDSGTLVSKAGGSIGAEQASLTSGEYTVTSTDIANSLDHVVFRFGHDGNTQGPGAGDGWGEAADASLSVIPEPITSGLLAIFGAAVFIIRRKLMS